MSLEDTHLWQAGVKQDVLPRGMAHEEAVVGKTLAHLDNVVVAVLPDPSVGQVNPPRGKGVYLDSVGRGKRG